jgi:hypothetical protein
VGSTTGSRGEVPGERKPVIRDDDIILYYNNNNKYGEVAPVLKHNAINVYMGEGVNFHALLTLALAGYQWLASRSSHFTPEKRHSVRSGWVRWDPEPVLDAVAKTNPCLCRGYNPGRPSRY